MNLDVSAWRDLKPSKSTVSPCHRNCIFFYLVSVLVLNCMNGLIIFLFDVDNSLINVFPVYMSSRSRYILKLRCLTGSGSILLK